MDDPETDATPEPPPSPDSPPGLRHLAAPGEGSGAGRRAPGERSIRRPLLAGGPSAWQAAEAYGFDMSLIEANLRRTPAERIRAHGRALALAVVLREAMRRRRAGP